jgi:hypothetical protein
MQVCRTCSRETEQGEVAQDPHLEGLKSLPLVRRVWKRKCWWKNGLPHNLPRKRSGPTDMDCLAANNYFPNDSRFVGIAASFSRLDSQPLPLL